MKTIISTFCLIVLTLTSQAQVLEFENAFEPESLTKDSYLGTATYVEETGQTILTYVEKNLLNVRFKTYTLDKELNLESEDVEQFGLIEAATKEFRDQYDWFKYAGDSYIVEGVTVSPSWGGKLVARKKRITYTWNWSLGTYLPNIELLDKVTITGTEDNKIYMYMRAENHETGDVLVLVGHKDEKGGDKHKQAKNFQFMTISKDLEITWGDEVNFDYVMAVNYSKVIPEPTGYSFEVNPYNKTEEYYSEYQYLQGDIGQLAQDQVGSLAEGELAIVFSPISNMMTKKAANPNPGEHTVVFVDHNAAVLSRVDVSAPTSGWLINDMIKFPDGEIIAFGPAKEEKYVNTLKPTNSPYTYKSNTSESKWKSYQIMKIVDGELAWINSVTLDEMELMYKKPPSQKKSPDYSGKRFDVAQVVLTPSKDFMIAGQLYKWKDINQDVNGDGSNEKVGRRKEFQDIIMFQFGEDGIMKAQYGIRRDNNNQYAKEMFAPQDLFISNDGTAIYWIYGEIDGFRKGWGNMTVNDELVTLVKRKMLFYSTVSIVDVENASLTDFYAIGTDEKGKQKYYTNPEYPYFLSPEGTYLNFVGEDKKGKEIWVGRMLFE